MRVDGRNERNRCIVDCVPVAPCKRTFPAVRRKLWHFVRSRFCAFLRQQITRSLGCLFPSITTLSQSGTRINLSVRKENNVCLMRRSRGGGLGGDSGSVIEIEVPPATCEMEKWFPEAQKTRGPRNKTAFDVTNGQRYFSSSLPSYSCRVVILRATAIYPTIINEDTSCADWRNLFILICETTVITQVWVASFDLVLLESRESSDFWQRQFANFSPLTPTIPELDVEVNVQEIGLDWS